MRNWDERDETGVCRSETEYRHVRKLCAALDIPCTHVDFVKEYWNEVFRWVLIPIKSMTRDSERNLVPVL